MDRRRFMELIGLSPAAVLLPKDPKGCPTTCECRKPEYKSAEPAMGIMTTDKKRSLTMCCWICHKPTRSTGKDTRVCDHCGWGYAIQWGPTFKLGDRT